MRSTKVFDTYWRFAVERQAIFYRRLAGKVGAWTSDPILRSYRFTNAYRAADRVSQYLIREVQYRAGRPQAPEDIFFRTLLFKIFNRIETWEALEYQVGPIVWQEVKLQALSDILDTLISRGARIYSPAYIMPSPTFGYSRKHENHWP
jgi:alpha-glutamyl/putrescinyl thymine pyrophosphorylase clade 1